MAAVLKGGLTRDVHDENIHAIDAATGEALCDPSLAVFEVASSWPGTRGSLCDRCLDTATDEPARPLARA